MEKILFFIFALLIFIPGCKKEKVNEDWVIELPVTFTPEDLNQWAVVKYSLPKLRLEPIPRTKILNYLPLASLAKVIKRENEIKNFDNETNYWYYIDYEGEKGWVFGTFIELYNNYEEAEKRSEEILIGKE